MNAIIGNEVPVTARIIKKKNNQRGPIVGKVVLINWIRPIHPVIDKTTAEGIVDFTDIDDIIEDFQVDFLCTTMSDFIIGVDD